MTRRLRLAATACLALVLAALFGGSPAGAAQGDPEWLAWINLYRSVAGLPSVEHDPSLDPAVAEHARYLVDLDQDGLCASFPHCEAIPPGTVEGDRAARNILTLSSAALSEREVVESLIAAPFHALSLLRPGLTHVGFGLYSNPDASGTTSAGVIDVNSDASPTDLSSVVTWPADGASVPLTAYSGNETPDPLIASSCQSLAFARPGAPQEAGLPIIVMNVPDAPVGAVLVERSSGTELTTCVATSHDYPDDSTASLVLEGALAFFVIPEQPLRPGESYQLTLTGAVDRLIEFDVVTPPASPPGWSPPPSSGGPTDTTPTSGPQPGETSPADTLPQAANPQGSAHHDDGFAIDAWLAIVAWLLAVTALGLLVAAILAARSESAPTNESLPNALLALAAVVILPASLFLDFGAVRLGTADRSYRGIDIPVLAWGVPVLAAVLCAAIISDLRAARPFGSVARSGSIAIPVVAGLCLLAAEFSGSLVPTSILPSSLRRASVDWQSGLAPWAMLLVGLIAAGAIFARSPWTALFSSASAKPLRWWLAAAGLTVGLTGLVVSRYLPVASVTVLGEEVTLYLRALPAAGPLSLAGLLGLVVAIVLLLLNRTTAGLLVGGIAVSVSAVPAALLAGAGAPLLRGVARLGALDIVSKQLSAPDLELNPIVTEVPTLLFAATLLCTVSLVALAWDSDG